MLYIIIIGNIILIYTVLLLHEGIHYVSAQALHYHPKLVKLNLLSYKVIYLNRDKPYDNLLIAALPALILSFIGFIMPLNNYTIFIKGAFCLNIINLTVLTSDGEVILLSLSQIFRR